MEAGAPVGHAMAHPLHGTVKLIMLAKLFCLGVLLSATPALADNDGERAALARLVGEIDQLAPLPSRPGHRPTQASARLLPWQYRLC